MIEATIRKCTSEDLESVSAIEREIADGGEIYNFTPCADPAARVNGYFFVAEVEGRVVGFVCAAVKANRDMGVLPEGEDYLEVEDLIVTREQRNRGIGGRLLDRVLEVAAANDVERAILFSASKDLDAVIRFYRRGGFKTWNVMMYR